MSAAHRRIHGRAVKKPAEIFPPLARAVFASSYPEGAHMLDHELRAHPLLELDALACLGESLPDTSVEYNRGDLPVGIEGKPDGNGLTIGETIRGIDRTDSWAVLKNIEHDPTYRALLHELLGELAHVVEPRTGAMLQPQGYIFVSSPEAVTPYHFDPEHNILLQLRGRKTVTIFPAGDSRYAADTVHEAYHTGGGRELRWQRAFAREGIPFRLCPGEAIYIPVMAPHYVQNGPEVSVSLSITWRSDWSFAEADARAFNKFLRRFGLAPAPPRRWPQSNRPKALAWRIVRRLPGLY